MRLLPPGINPPWMTECMSVSVPDVVDVIGEVVRQQYIVLQCKINESTSWMSWIARNTIRVQAVLKPFHRSSSFCKEADPSFSWPVRSTRKPWLEQFCQVVKSYSSIIFSINCIIMSWHSDLKFGHFQTTLTEFSCFNVYPFSFTMRNGLWRQHWIGLWSWCSLRDRFPCTSVINTCHRNFFWLFGQVFVDSVHDANPGNCFVTK